MIDFIKSVTDLNSEDEFIDLECGDIGCNSCPLSYDNNYLKKSCCKLTIEEAKNIAYEYLKNKGE